MKNKNLFISLGDAYYGLHPYQVLKELNKTQFLTSHELEAIQLNYLKKFIKYVCEHVPFYIEYAATHDVTINTLKDIQKLPIVDKKLINSRYNDFISDECPKPYFVAKTTGSSGVPFTFIKTREGESYKIASFLRAKNWFDVGRCDKVLKISGVPPISNGLKEHIKDFIRFKSTNRTEIFISDITDANIPALVKHINEHKPIAIVGLAGGVALLAVKLKGNENLKHNIKAIFINSESVTPLQRKQIFDTFGVEPRSSYLATEGSIAQECECGGMHLDMEGCYTEILNEDENGVGDIVLTMLHSYDMPLIRYRIGDKAKWRKESCACGRGLKLIENVIGRETDVIILPDGKEYSSANLNYIPANLKNVNNLAGYQLFQTSPTNILLKVVLVDSTNTDVIGEMRQEFEKIFTGCVLTIEICDHLQRGKGGKLRLINPLSK